jgi:uncharacterized protein (TIGR00255 family)
MLKSMTGYGKASCSYENKTITIELRSVNSKQLDINTRMPSLYKEKEHEIRNEIGRQAERGKIDISISVEQTEQEKSIKINQTLLKDYFSQIKTVASELDLPISENILLAALRLPDTLKPEIQSLEEEEWKCIFSCLQEALTIFGQFRLQEGKALEKDINKRVELITHLLSDLKTFESARIDKIKERLQKNLNEFIPAGSIDANRFEQEIIYFLEKLDITEEKVRLRNHCGYFLNTMLQEDAPGRKLGFISQEMGREINTIGSKANDSDIQKCVVMMKDELEKIKEQLMNIL